MSIGNNEANETVTKPRRFLTLAQVIERTSLSKASIYRAMTLRAFPRPVMLSVQRVGWIESEIDAWCEQRCQRLELGVSDA